jgi:hypothetical protein
MLTEYETTVSHDGLISPREIAWRINSGAARGIAGRFQAIGDQVLLSLILTYLALWAGILQAGETPSKLLAMRMSIGHSSKQILGKVGDRWIELKLHYIDHWSLKIDLQILAMTFPTVLKGMGAA